MDIFLWTILFGILAGLIFELGYMLRRLFSNTLIVTIIVDIATSIIYGILFIICIYSFNNGIVRLYEIIGMVCGFLITVLSLGKLVAIFSDIIYNIYVKAKCSVEMRIMERKNAKQKICKND